ncbi:MAG: hypothetical protein NTV01_04550, partial [Bacteroidia bacterium]|nr:hypothetical protein [Bacteroidia bacterium]
EKRRTGKRAKNDSKLLVFIRFIVLMLSVAGKFRGAYRGPRFRGDDRIDRFRGIDKETPYRVIGF